MKQRKHLNDEEKAVVVAKYEEGRGTFKICAEHDISTSQFYRILRRHGIKPDGRSVGFRSLTKEQTAELIRLYVQEATSLEVLAKQFGICVPTVKSVLLYNDIPRRKGGNRFDELTSEVKAKIVAMREAGSIVSDIVKVVGVSHKHVVKVLRLNDGLSCDGGMEEPIIEQLGYCLVRMSTDDPLFPMARSGGYVLEHRYVMAKYLNRPLKEWETVHHIDGDKTNNTNGNLQLRIGKHGKGEAYCCLDCGSKRISPVELALAV